ncbi:hypothetical protein ZWY2020_000485 [Hordeum vulgare]|nr:hypothetical protein ZWY2020_000485 [Hordeum vulgare]
MEPPRRTKRPAVDPDDDDVKAAAEARRCYGPAAYDFLDDDEMPDGAASQGTGGDTEGQQDEAWLGAAGDVDGDGQAAMTKRARKAMDRQEEDERILEGVVGSRAVFDIKKRIAALLRPGETAPRALRGAGARARAARRQTRATSGGERWTRGTPRRRGVRRPDLARRDAREALEDASARKDIRVLTLAIRPPSGSPTAPPVDVIAGHDDMINPAIKAVASGKVSAIDLEMDLQSLRELRQRCRRAAANYYPTWPEPWSARRAGQSAKPGWAPPATSTATASAADRRSARGAMDRQEEDERILEGVVGSRAVFDIKKRIAALLRPGETAPRALRRLKGAPGAPAGDRRVRGKEMDELVDASAELVRRGASSRRVRPTDDDGRRDASASFPREKISAVSVADRSPPRRCASSPANHDDADQSGSKAPSSRQRQKPFRH